MQPRIIKRWNSSASSVLTKSGSVARKGRKGHLYMADQMHPAPSPEEEVRIIKRRVQKAERDERMDITLALTPPKTYMGGFTRPRDLRAANWFPGGPYLQKNKVYESPPESAYEPHTVFMLETRHRVRHGVGRVDAKDHIVGVCRAADFVKLVRKYNSPDCPYESMESMDNACWPWLPKSGKVLKPTRWWGFDERLDDIMKEIYEDPDYTSEFTENNMKEAEDEVEEEEVSTAVPQKMKKVSVTTQNGKEVAEAEMRANPPQINPMESDIDHMSHSNSASPAPSSSSASTPEHTSPHPSLTHMSNLPPAVPDRAIIRKQYFPRLASEPFWLPLIAVTVSTRPLALSISRLSKAHERGLPFYASMASDDRKCLYSFSHRMACMRLNRVHHLTLETIKRLSGHKGGFIGIRFGVNEKGRGIGGEALADPIQPDKRIVKVAVGKWYAQAEDQHDLYKSTSEEWGGGDAVNVAFMNEWGRRLDVDGNVIPLTEEELSTDEVEEADDEADMNDEAEANDEADLDNEETGEDEDRLLKDPGVAGRTKFKLKPSLRGDDEGAVQLRRKLAVKNAQRHRSVMQV